MLKSWLTGKSGGFIAFLAISALVVGGLGWATAAALRLEQEQLEAGLHAEQSNDLRLALWRLDSLVAPALAKEDSRPYNYYSAIFAPPVVLQNTGNPVQPGTVLEPSPLLSTDLPDWMLLHFQIDKDSGLRSPQVLSNELVQLLRKARIEVSLNNVTAERAQLLSTLKSQLHADALVSLIAQQETRPPLEDVTLVPGGNPINSAFNPTGQVQMGQQAAQPQAVDKEYSVRLNRQGDSQQRGGKRLLNDDSAVASENFRNNGADWLSDKKGKPQASEQVVVTVGPMVPLWLAATGQQERLVFARHVQIGRKELCQGIVLDWPRLQQILADEAKKEDLFPQARIEHVQEDMPAHSERTMTMLPLQLDPGPIARPQALGWTPLRAGLALAWLAALLALSAVGLGGWSLLNLSERRIRFVSAVTHELRTPLTTLRLYLDMLASGIIQDPKKKEEYIQTLNTEADRLNRLVANVLDFSRLENQRPRLLKAEIKLGDLLEYVRTSWQARCEAMGKQLILELPATDVVFLTDIQMVQQILGNLIDNACKYSRDAEDRRIWLRARRDRQRFLFEVEDRGPGVMARERRSIFRPFRRGRNMETTGGVGLGLALAQRWAHLLGGTLRLQSASNQQGACFQLVLPDCSLIRGPQGKTNLLAT